MPGLHSGFWPKAKKIYFLFGIQAGRPKKVEKNLQSGQRAWAIRLLPKSLGPDCQNFGGPYRSFCCNCSNGIEPQSKISSNPFYGHGS